MPNYKPKPIPPTDYPRFAGKYGSNGGKVGKVDYRNVTPWGSPPPCIRTTTLPPSLNAADTTGSFAPKHDPQKYTGTQCIGIATLHKSNAVPVFSQQAAIDAATMRRN